MTIGAFNPDNYSAYKFANTGNVAAGGFAVQPLFWGSEWASLQTPSPDQIIEAISKVVAGPYLAGIAQYGVGRGEVAREAWFDTSSGLGKDFDGQTPVYDQVRRWHQNSFAGVKNAFFDEVSLEPSPQVTIQVLAIFSPPNILPQDRSFGGFNAAIPAEWLGFFPGAMHFVWVGNTGDLDTLLTPVFAHEIAELITDPDWAAGLNIPGVRDGTQMDPNHPGIPLNQIADGFDWPTVDRVGGIRVAAYWREDARRPAVPAAARRNGPFLQSSYGHTGNFEAILCVDGRLRHYWRDNDKWCPPWRAGGAPAMPEGRTALSANLIEQAPGDHNPPGPLVAIAQLDDQSLALTSTNGNGGWSPLAPLAEREGAQSAATGAPAMIRSRFAQDSLLIAVPEAGDIVLRFVVGHAARRVLTLTPPQPPVSVQMMQANFGPVGQANGTPFPDAPGNLELVVRCRPANGGPDELWFAFVAGSSDQPSPGGPWSRLTDAATGLPIAASGESCLFQSTYGAIGNFELLVPNGDRIDHWVRRNDVDGAAWNYVRSLSPWDGATPLAVAAFQSSYRPASAAYHNFEALIRARTVDGVDELRSSWFDGDQWRGEFTVETDGQRVVGVDAL